MPTSSLGLREGRLYALLLCLGLLSACVSLGSDDAPRQVQVTSDQVTIAGPRGFCVDPTSTRDSGDTGFVLLGNCAAISGSARARQPDVAAVLTATVSAPSTGESLTDNLGALEEFFRSNDGRTLLSRSNDASSVQILETRQGDGMFLLHARDTSGGQMAGVAQDYWRAYMEIGPRLATLSVLSLADAEVSDADALATLLAFAAAVQATNSADLPQGAAQPS